MKTEAAAKSGDYYVIVSELSVSILYHDTFCLTIVYSLTHTPLVYEADKVIPLPTYDQSQKYEHDGVLVELEEDDEEVPQRLVGSQKLPGTCLDFTLFFFCELVNTNY